jgi:hypothetical protein
MSRRRALGVFSGLAVDFIMYKPDPSLDEVHAVPYRLDTAMTRSVPNVPGTLCANTSSLDYPCFMQAQTDQVVLVYHDSFPPSPANWSGPALLYMRSSPTSTTHHDCLREPPARTYICKCTCNSCK